jgi:hypothetical protein
MRQKWRLYARKREIILTCAENKTLWKQVDYRKYFAYCPCGMTVENYSFFRSVNARLKRTFPLLKRLDLYGIIRKVSCATSGT